MRREYVSAWAGEKRFNTRIADELGVDGRAMDGTSRSKQKPHWLREAGVLLSAALIGGFFAAALIPAIFSKGPHSEAVAETRARPAGKVPPLPMQQAYKPLSPEEALAENENLPFSTAPIEQAPPLVVPLNAAEFAGRRSSLDCLTAAVYYEAAEESETGKRSVAQVVLNRARHPAFPSSVCGVVYQGSERRTGCQFTFTCDGSLARRPSRAGWDAARKVALAALSGYVEPRVGMATHYHADYVVPYWASSLAKIAKIDRHIFYRWSGGWGRRAAFTQSVISQEQFFDDQAQFEALANLDTEPTLPMPYAGPVPRGARLAADEAAGSLTGGDAASLSSELAAPSIKADAAPAKLAADNVKGSLRVD